MNHFEERKRYSVSTFGLSYQDMEALYYHSTLITWNQCESYLLPVADFDPETAWSFDEDGDDLDGIEALIKVVNEVMRDANLIGLDYVWFQGV